MDNLPSDGETLMANCLEEHDEKHETKEKKRQKKAEQSRKEENMEKMSILP